MVFTCETTIICSIVDGRVWIRSIKHLHEPTPTPNFTCIYTRRHVWYTQLHVIMHDYTWLDVL